MRPCLFILAFGLLTGTACAQRSGMPTNVRDTSIALFSVYPSYAQQVPGGDLAYRFGTNSNIGLGFFRKLRSQYLFGLEGGFIFGNKVIEPGVLQNVMNSYGQIVDKDGVMADVFVYERGWTAMGYVGRLFPIVGPNPNSGLVLKLGGGFMRHKVRIQAQSNVVPQISDDYMQGYDRLCAGPATMAYIGYQHFGNRRLINFHIGVELLLGFTEALHPYNFDTESYNKEHRIDMLSGLRVGWSLPIYRRFDERFMY